VTAPASGIASQHRYGNLIVTAGTDTIANIMVGTQKHWPTGTNGDGECAHQAECSFTE
jgi:hypothetical protein